MTPGTKLSDLLQNHSGTTAAILSEDRPPLTYAALRDLISHSTRHLRSLGIGPADRVAIVLPNGPAMATAFVAVATSACAAPLNPGYQAEEFRFFLDDLQASALIVAAGSNSPAIDVARQRGTQILALTTTKTAPAGAFELEQLDPPAVPSSSTATPQPTAETALILHTSGTTSRPKMVPLSAGNLRASAANIAGTLRLQENDRCLNVMPLFHIHGLVGALLSTLHAGASIYCTPGFNALKFFSWLEAAKPTWYTAVPTMHQVILARAGRNRAVAQSTALRFIRSSSSSLPPQILTGLEAAFNCPVIESYGMTEAAHQMASNHLPPGHRVPGTVGFAAGPEVAIMDEDGTLLLPAETGEIVIRGPNVMSGYENNPAGNAAAFSGGWFRTGDQGEIDQTGLLRITGRLKEIINRGGEKISPREIDEVLLDHPAVTQAVTFAIPHKSLGEDVGAAVVFADGATATERELRDFVARRLAAFKVPRMVKILPELPKGATGKVQRIGLAEKLGLGAAG